MARFSYFLRLGSVASSFTPSASDRAAFVRWPTISDVLGSRISCMRFSAMAAPSTSSQAFLPQPRRCSLFRRHHLPTSTTATAVSWLGVPTPETSRSIDRHGRELRARHSIFGPFDSVFPNDRNGVFHLIPKFQLGARISPKLGFIFRSAPPQ